MCPAYIKVLCDEDMDDEYIDWYGGADGVMDHMYEAISNGDFTQFEDLFDDYEKVYNMDYGYLASRYDLLAMAIREHAEESYVLRLIEEEDLDCDQLFDHNMTPLMLECQKINPSLKVVKALVDHKVDIIRVDDYHFNALGYAFINNEKMDIIKYLLSKNKNIHIGKCLNVSDDVKSEKVIVPGFPVKLVDALNSVNVIKYCIEEKLFDVNDVSNCISILNYIAYKCEFTESVTGLIDFLIRKGADINFVDCFGYTPFCWVYHDNLNLPFVNFLLKFQPDPFIGGLVRDHFTLNNTTMACVNMVIKYARKYRYLFEYIITKYFVKEKLNNHLLCDFNVVIFVIEQFLDYRVVNNNKDVKFRI